jgi:16S rRNA (uracil1498-N3)-methyltransferase
MERHYFYVPDLRPREKRVLLLGEEFHHLDKVLRLKEKDIIFLLNGKGWVFKAKILSKGKRDAEIRILSFQQYAEPDLKIHLLQALLPGDKMDFLLRSCAEIGVSNIYPVMTANCIVRFKNKSIPASKFLRWQRILIQGIKQSGNPWLPGLSELGDFESAVIFFREKGIPKFLLTEGGSVINPQFLMQVDKEVALLIGPEGGFTQKEIQQAKEAGFIPLSLGDLRLRSEVSALMAIAIFKYSYLYSLYPASR